MYVTSLFSEYRYGGPKAQSKESQFELELVAQSKLISVWWYVKTKEFCRIQVTTN